MESSAIDFTPWGLDAEWPARRWIEPINGRPDEPIKGVRLGHADDSAMVLTCTYPRARFDAEVTARGLDPVREIAFETTYAQVNLALHQIRKPGERPEGLIGSLVDHASQEADRYSNWPAARWGKHHARTIRLTVWQSGLSATDREAYVIVHACGFPLNDVRLTPVDDLSGYDLGKDPDHYEAMHWELWPAGPDIDYADLASVLR
ncbi:MAG: hypothetical protein J2P28_09095 [Actinobacteria bacterium]|nr:hypothetical protein [Actinomycetota bacterium]MBO0835660.1 hypothetical protein [Actinomycetota bacterium]